jgi:hypothetical protein
MLEKVSRLEGKDVGSVVDLHWQGCRSSTKDLALTQVCFLLPGPCIDLQVRFFWPGPFIVFPSLFRIKSEPF